MLDVSIVCNAYNHGPYIRDALDGFLAQETEYSFEVLVMDDASPDGTADIIREYAAKYPDIIKPLLFEENQYSQGKRPGLQNKMRAVGKYLAICEGDDYWIDPLKLQKQISYMEAHPDCTFSFTNGYVRYGEELGPKVIPWTKASVRKKGQVDFDAGELEMLGYIPTASFVYRRETPDLPMRKGAFLGDAYTKLSKTAQGYAHYIDEPTVVYRRAVSESATAVWIKNNSVYIKQCDAFILLFQGLNEITDFRYADVFNMRICEWKIEKCCRLGDVKSLKEMVKSGEIKALRKGNWYSWLVYNAKCRYCKLFTWVRGVLKSIFKGLNR